MLKLYFSPFASLLLTFNLVTEETNTFAFCVDYIRVGVKYTLQLCLIVINTCFSNCNVIVFE